MAKEMEMSRRQFLKGSMAMGAAAALGATGFRVSAEETETETAAGEESNTYLEQADYEISEERDYDVVVVGAGGGGMTAATRAAELGLKTVLLEQRSVTGGTTLYTEGLFAINSHWQKENGVNPPDLGYDLFTEAMDYHHWYANGSLFRKYIDESANDIDWLESVGVVFQGTGTMCDNEYNTWHQYQYEDGQISGSTYVANLTAAVENAGADLVLGSEGVNIVQDEDGTVTAVIAKEENGYVQYNASKGVILATGGYADNPDMIREFGKNPDRIDPMGAGGRNGFGINAARQAGGTMAPSPGCLVFYGGCIPGISYGTHLYCASAFQPYFWINQDCERFVNEYYAERNFSFSGNAQSMQDRVISIVTQAQMDDMYENGGTFGCGEYIHAGEPLTELWDQFNAQVEGGNEYVHGPIDTLEELADELGLDAEKLTAAVEKYNGYCATGVDEEFAKDAQYLFALESGPYYAFELHTGIFCTVGGMKINSNAQVLDDSSNPIPHLYAIGCDAGGIYGDAYDVSICEGSCQGFAVFTGKMAAEHIAENN
ncbi:MAG: FAD-dependent oxidoreductase [Lachnospiraceae bacterium]|nr:FAD-dependent oxidoreductase [Lachnospiraceae bacterium]